MLRTYCAIVFCCAFAGCSDGKAVVQGQLKKDGKPYIAGKNEQVMIVFQEMDGDKLGKYTFPASGLDGEGRFTVTGPGGEGLKPGKYKASVVSLPFTPGPDAPAGDRFKGAYAPEKSPFVIDVVPGKPAVVLEMK